MIKIEIINIGNHTLPNYSTEGSVGVDLLANIDSTITIGAFERRLIPTGIKVAIPKGYELQLRSRSGLSLNKGLIVLNSPGTIDEDYRGEINVILMNVSNCMQYINPGDRIAQMVLSKYEKITWKLVEKLSDTVRNEGGFGSTGY